MLWRMTGRGIRWAVRYRLAQHRGYLVLARRRYGQACLGPGTELVIDGFTRSGVTFALYAFQVAQDRPVRVAHHIHAPAHLIEAARRGIPVLLPVRDPGEVALSTLIREPYVTPGMVLRAYIRFHRALLPHRKAMVVAPFDQLTTSFDAIVRALNERFGTAFRPFDHTEPNVARVFRMIEDRALHPPWSRALGAFENGLIGAEEYERAVEGAGGRARLSPPDERRVPRPSSEREAVKAELRRGLQMDQTLLDRARAVFRAMLDPARMAV
jgi:hypothetical protein